MSSIEKRISKTGKQSYRVKVRLRGFPTQSASFERLTDARIWSQQTESAIREGRHFKTAEAKKHTFSDMIDRYKKNVLVGTIGEVKQSFQLEWWKAELGDYTLNDVTPSLVVEARDKLLSGITYRKTPRNPATVNRYLAALSSCYSTAVNEWGWVDDSPMRKIKKLKESKGRVRFLSDGERVALLNCCQQSKSPHLYPIVVLALSTGMRQGEILNLCWADVELDKRYLILHETKNGDRRRVPVTSHALEVLVARSKIRRIDTDRVFYQKNGDGVFDVRPFWLTAVKEADVVDFKFHDLRHSAASYLAMNGASLAEIAEVLGHKTLQMVKRYAHLSEDHTASVVESMNNKMFGD